MTAWWALWVACVVVVVLAFAATPARLRRWSHGDGERFISLLRWRTLVGIGAAIAALLIVALVSA